MSSAEASVRHTQRPRVVDLLAGRVPPGATVRICGWIRTKRDTKGLAFLTLTDGSSPAPLQVVATTELPNFATEVRRLTSGCAVCVEGELVATPDRPQPVELRATRLEVIGWVEDPDAYPIQPKPHSYEFLRDVAHLRPRTATFAAMTRVRNALAMAIHRFFQDRGFVWIHAPILTANDAEGAGAMFRVTTLDLDAPPRTPEGRVDTRQDFFGRPAYLTVSAQLNLEAYCLALGRVYSFGPTFRAENSNTPRHLAEFWMVEPEIAFADLADDVDLAEEFLQSIFAELLDRCGDDLRFFSERHGVDLEARLRHVVETPMVRLDYSEAIALLQRSGRTFQYPVVWGADLQTEHERYLTEELVRGPVAVLNYPKEIKAFYMRLNEDGRTVAAMDVLVPGIGEIIGGSQREERLEVLERRMEELGLRRDVYWWYLDLRRYGTAPHAGFGLGFERALQYVTGTANIRDVIPFPRTPDHLEF